MTSVVVSHAWAMFRLAGMVMGLGLVLILLGVLVFFGAYLINCEWVMEPLFAFVVWAYRVGGF